MKRTEENPICSIKERGVHPKPGLKEFGLEMRGLLGQIPYSPYLLSIPGVGPLSAAVFFGELRNPDHINDAKQIIKYAGYDPMETDSGKWVGRKRISKKGRWLLRKMLFFMCLRVVHQCHFFGAYYRRKLERENIFGQRLRRKEALCAMAIKLIRVIFALFRDKRKHHDQAPSLAVAP